MRKSLVFLGVSIASSVTEALFARQVAAGRFGEARKTLDNIVKLLGVVASEKLEVSGIEPGPRMMFIVDEEWMARCDRGEINVDSSNTKIYGRLDPTPSG